ncbi:hypothetical protein FJ546_18845 [Mesorhizobium sp. B2-4-19]|uniref:hypothetical protein n=1 Tax=Mesorhizobium sp. B2-4-19 TaxID=2589930 RepID=UPI0011296C0C|nr:hypothetical protein [Mesorhizobium sp. B2-4-19]TPK61105.1 hypothetical protein FJ546_18845 [Mesorhizobium sp. B2-4-19]
MNDFDPSGAVAGGIGDKTGFFRSRWRGGVSLNRLFWRDMVVVATALSIASSVAALVLLSLKLPLVLVLAVHFAPVPYNIFLTWAVWRTAEKVGGAKASLVMLGSALWLIATVVV